jgi:hypothetical protein
MLFAVIPSNARDLLFAVIGSCCVIPSNARDLLFAVIPSNARNMLFFERARLQPRRTSRPEKGALAPEGRIQ